MPISSNDFGKDKEVFFTEGFKTMVRSQRELLLRETTEIPIRSQSELQAYRYDFYRLLRVYGIDSHMYWVTAYLNGIENPMADCSGLVSIKMIDEQQLSSRIARSNTVEA